MKTVKMNRLAYGAIALVLLGAAASLFFIVDQREYAVVSSVGGTKQIIEAPGLYVKWPAPLERVRFLDRRTQILNSAKNIRFPTWDKGNISLDIQVSWRIADPRTYFLHYHQSPTLAEKDILERIKTQLAPLLVEHTRSALVGMDYEHLADTVQATLGKQNAASSISSSEKTQTLPMHQNPSATSSVKGIEILDIHLQRSDLTAPDTPTRDQIMANERAQILETLRTQSAAEVQAVRLEALQEREQIVSEAYEQAQIIEAEGDAKAAEIEAEAARTAPGFYKFYKDLQTLRRSTNAQDMLIVDPLSALKADGVSKAQETRRSP